MKHGLQKPHFFVAGEAKTCNLIRFLGDNRAGGETSYAKKRLFALLAKSVVTCSVAIC
jgi:hypothetical protein